MQTVKQQCNGCTWVETNFWRFGSEVYQDHTEHDAWTNTYPCLIQNAFRSSKSTESAGTCTIFMGYHGVFFQDTEHPIELLMNRHNTWEHKRGCQHKNTKCTVVWNRMPRWEITVYTSWKWNVPYIQYLKFKFSESRRALQGHYLFTYIL